MVECANECAKGHSVPPSSVHPSIQPVNAQPIAGKGSRPDILGKIRETRWEKTFLLHSSFHSHFTHCPSCRTSSGQPIFNPPFLECRPRAEQRGNHQNRVTQTETANATGSRSNSRTKMKTRGRVMKSMRLKRPYTCSSRYLPLGTRASQH